MKNVTELHHGIVKVESTPGYGTIFIVRLQKGRAHFTDEECVETLAENGLIYSYEPLQEIPEDMKEATPDNDVSETEQDEEQCRHSVLLVEDNEELLQILKALFEPTYRVILAANGQEGLDKVREETPDIVVSDIMMPEMSGTEMCTRIKMIQYLPYTGRAAHSFGLCRTKYHRTKTGGRRLYRQTFQCKRIVGTLQQSGKKPPHVAKEIS